MDEFLLRRPVDPRECLRLIRERYPDPERQLRIFYAAVVEDRNYLHRVVEDWVAAHPS